MGRPQGSVFIATSLDGFIARPNGAVDWLSIVEREGEDYGFKTFFESVDTLVMGRKTYETALGFPSWPYAGKRCVVLTTDLSRPSRHGEQFFSGDLALLFERLGMDGAHRVYVDGGVTIAQALRAGLVDDVTISLIPVLLGAGVPLVPNLGRDRPLRLAKHRAFESGLVQLQFTVEAP